MDFDRPRPGASTQGASEHDAPTPGRTSLTQDLAPIQRRAAPETGSGQRPTPAEPENRGPRLTLQMILQRRHRAPSHDDTDQVHAAAARGTATAAAQLPHLDQVQRSFGHHDVSGVKAHVGPEATASARAMGAHAYATGDHVVLGDRADLHTVAHEAAHVVQQRAGVQLKGGVGAVGDAYEQHADAVADKVVRGESAQALLDPYAGGAAGGGGVQRKPITAEGRNLGPGDIDEVMKLLASYDVPDSPEGRAAVQALLDAPGPAASLSDAASEVRAHLGGHGGGASHAAAGAEHGASAATATMAPPTLAAASSSSSSSTAAAGGGTADPIARITQASFDQLTPTPIGNSRGKPVYFFDASGAPCTQRAAAYIVDTEMDRGEVANYEQVQSQGLRAPRVFGRTSKGPIVEWIQGALTVDVAKHGGVNAIRAQMNLDEMTRKPFNAARWTGALNDVRRLVAIGYTSPDLQFMVDPGGNVYLMDLEASGQGANTPQFLGAGHPDAKLQAICEFLEKSIAQGGAAEAPATTASAGAGPASAATVLGSGMLPPRGMPRPRGGLGMLPPRGGLGAARMGIGRGSSLNPGGAGASRLMPPPRRAPLAAMASVTEVVAAGAESQSQAHAMASSSSSAAAATTEEPSASDPDDDGTA